jgi:hypothetical protein
MTRIDFAAHVVGDELHAVTDPQHGHARAQGVGVDLGSARLVHARGSAAEDQACWIPLLQLRPRGRAGHKLAVHVRLAHAARDQLAELRSEIEDEDGLARCFLQLRSLSRGRGW